MRTTNPNESFNIQAWRRTPKYLLVTKTVSTAVLEYNKGTNELPVVFNMLDIRDGYYFALHATSSSRKRRMDASRHANETSKKKRLRRKLFKPEQAYEHASKERVVISRRLQLLEMCDLYTLHHYIIFFCTYCMIIVAVQQIYKHYLSIIFMCYWFIHKEDGFYFPKHLHFSL